MGRPRRQSQDIPHRGPIYSHHPLESSIEYYSQGLALLAAVNRTNLSGAKERLEEFAWLRRCIADKNLYYNRVETYWQDDNVI